MATDKRLDQTSNLTDFDYALIVKGDQISKISKADLASVVAGLLVYETSKIGFYTSYNPDLDSIKTNARGFINDGYKNNPISESNGWAFFESKMFPNGNVQQLLTGWFIPHIRYIRNFQNGGWTDWFSI